MYVDWCCLPQYTRAAEKVCCAVLEAILARSLMASSEYLEHPWMLSERMARHGRGERPFQWFALEAYLGLVVDSALKGKEGAWSLTQLTEVMTLIVLHLGPCRGRWC